MSFTPTEEQELILDHDPERHARVLAGPGTGKSATLVKLIEELHSEQSNLKIKLLTFTRAATGELAQKVSEHSTIAAERPSTIHSFSISTLLQNPGAGGFPEPLRIADDWENRYVVLATLSRRLGIRITNLRKLFTEMASKWESLKREQDQNIDPIERRRFLGAWEEHRRIFGYTLLAELPNALRIAMQEHDDLRGLNYDLLIVDEYQDLNACDLELIRLIGDTGCSIIGAGDDDQSIYSFRKAAPEGIRRFQEDYPEYDDYELSITHRCGSNIIEWANHVIQGDPDRPINKAPLVPAEGSPEGTVALLSFSGQRDEAKGIAAIVEKLIEDYDVPENEILILLRADPNNVFSNLIKEELGELSISFSDPNRIVQMLENEGNRKIIEVLRLLINRNDSISWASLLHNTSGISESFIDHIYVQAKNASNSFSEELFMEYEENFRTAPSSRSGNQAKKRIDELVEWLDSHELPNDERINWGEWILENSGDEIVPESSVEFKELLQRVDQIVEFDSDLGRYLSQIIPLGKDLEQNKSDGIRIMSLLSAKGLTVRATIIAATEDGILPHPSNEINEERRLLYVGMTRPKEYLFCTWARRRTGPTSRVGSSRVGSYRQSSPFFRSGPVSSQQGYAFLRDHF